MFVESIFETKLFNNSLKMDLTQNREGNNCYLKAWWENELVIDYNDYCSTYDSGLNLYIAGNYAHVLDGQVRNVSYTKK